MSRKDINQAPFTNETLLKLDIFRSCFREWLPVFIHSSVSKIYVCDFFAGSGDDPEDNPGSPMILLEEATMSDNRYCGDLKKNNKKLVFIFNELDKVKFERLKIKKNEHFQKCMATCPERSCILMSTTHCTSVDFAEIVTDDRFNDILNDNRIGKFILMDQYGYKLITENVFLKFVSAPQTDIIFFISSSSIKRFKNQKAVTDYFDVNRITFNENNPKACHRDIAGYFKSLIPADTEYYLHHFTIKKGSNYYGLIFGTGHTYGMEKFLKVCWAEDPKSGESNCNIDNDYGSDCPLLESLESNKLQQVKAEIRQAILEGRITDNLTGLKFALREGCQPKVFTEVVKELEKGQLITTFGDKRRQSTKIHQAPQYWISLP